MTAFGNTKSVRGFKRILVLLLFCVGLSSLASAQESEPRFRELPNFHQVGERLYRGAQPRPGGIQRLAKLGVNTVINLRANDERSRREGEEVRGTGMRYFQSPFERLGAPTDEQIREVLALINNAENGVVFVHCQRGADRTGTVIAVYHISHDGWTSERAQDEANARGMRFWQRGMKNYIRDYYRNQRERKDAAIPVEQLELVGH